MEYTKMIYRQFKGLKIDLVKHDTSPTGLPCYIEVHLGSKPKDPETLVIDLGNYLYRVLGLRYQMTPEFRGKGKDTTIRWFMSWDDVRPIKANIWKAVGWEPGLTAKSEALSNMDYLPTSFRSLIIQDETRGVRPPNPVEAA